VAASVTVTGLKEFRAALKAVGPEWPKALRQVNKIVADEVAALARGEAAGGNAIQSRAASAIKGRATQKTASVAVSGGKSVPFANVAFWGVKRHLGWFARPRYRALSQNLPKWVGNAWDVGGPGGPYAINPAIREAMPRIVEHYQDALLDLARRAFND
jgi:hypothetical protein